jgi:hypothetical protein
MYPITCKWSLLPTTFSTVLSIIARLEEKLKSFKVSLALVVNDFISRSLGASNYV